MFLAGKIIELVTKLPIYLSEASSVRALRPTIVKRDFARDKGQPLPSRVRAHLAELAAFTGARLFRC